MRGRNGKITLELRAEISKIRRSLPLKSSSEKHLLLSWVVTRVNGLVPKLGRVFIFTINCSSIRSLVPKKGRLQYFKKQLWNTELRCWVITTIAQSITENGEIVLRQSSAGYEIIVDGQFLISSASSNSSIALIELGLARLSPRNNLSVLVGGLGLGFSLKTALANPAVSQVTVVELEQRLIEWHHQDLIPGSSGAIQEPRSKIVNRDFLQFCDECQERFDFIAVDIDNGPDWLSHETNSPLYSEKYLKRIGELLHQNCILTIWSAAVSSELKRRLLRIYGNVDEIEVLDDNGEGKPISAYIYIVSNHKH